ncbi:AAA family ATPase [Jeotgalicoccus psychrophilus]|uniref:AAA family ATPase n=1 Tax=Jeotgalicoccus psychrophilus TaxID=157228 RepID=UPI000413E930|nr:AAA family ATPase [Jeotgalicoccus psychrophilus]
MKIILLFGPQAVGKMTIGEKVGTAFNLPLLHNHVTLDVIWPYIGWNQDTFMLSDQIRMGIFEHIAKEEEHPGIIFTFVWGFDLKEEWDYVDKIKSIFNKENHDIYFVELEAALDERIRRNKTEYRMEKKPSKRNVEFSHAELTASAKKHRLNSYDNEIKEDKYLKLDVTTLTAGESSQQIIDWINDN